MTLLKAFVNVLPASQSPDLGGRSIFEAGIKTNLKSVGIELDAYKAEKVVPEFGGKGLESLREAPRWLPCRPVGDRFEKHLMS